MCNQIIIILLFICLVLLLLVIITQATLIYCYCARWYWVNPIPSDQFQADDGMVLFLFRYDLVL